MKIRSALAFLLMTVAAPSMAVNISLGEISVPGGAVLSHSFTPPAGTGVFNFEDTFSFSILDSANSFGGVLELNSLFNANEINLTSVSLFSGSTSYGVDTSPLFFSFGGLGAGSYTLGISGSVFRSDGWYSGAVGYWGLLALTPGTAVEQPAPSTAVPEPGTLAIFGAGLVLVAFVTRRRNRRENAAQA